MNDILALAKVDFSSVFISVFLILMGIKAAVSLLEWMINKLGLETKWMRKHRQEHELLQQTAQSLASLQKNFEESMLLDNLMAAQREILADKINEKYKYYISIQGIPDDEVDEFTNLHTAYKGVGGNHSGDVKFEYCINHLPVIPVETKLVIE